MGRRAVRSSILAISIPDAVSEPPGAVSDTPMTENAPEAVLEDGLARLGVAAGPDLAERLLDYVALLQRWNAAYNLTSVREPAAIVRRHLLDSLAVLPYLHGCQIVDVGSGPGLPGLVLAMARPGSSFVVLDSAAKKTRFMRHVTARLALDNVEVVRARVEDYAPASGFDTVISRAFSSLGEFARLAGHLAGADGRLLAMKGKLVGAELAGLPAGWSIARTQALTVPGIGEARHLVELVRAMDEQDK